MKLITEKEVSKRKVIPFLLVLMSYSLLIFLFFRIALSPNAPTIVEETMDEADNIYDMGIYTFDISTYRKSLVRFRSGQLENGEYQSTFFCVDIEDATYVDPDCAADGQYEVFRIEYVTPKYIVPEYGNSQVVLTLSEKKDFPNITLLWDDIPDMILDESKILSKIQSDNLIDIVRNSFALPDKEVAPTDAIKK